MTIVAEQTFAPPGPGSWFLDPTHWTRPVTRFHAEVFPAAFERGFGESLRRYGSLLEYLGQATAKVHCVSDAGSEQTLVDFQTEEAIMTVLDARETAFADDLVSFGRAYGDLARDDHRRFVDAFRNGRIPGVPAD